MADEPRHFQTPKSTPKSRLAAATDGDSAMYLVRRLLDEVSTLFRQEISLASAEVSRSVSQAKAGVGSVATGGAVAFAGLLFLLGALVLGLSRVMAPWLAALIVGGVAAVIGLILLKAGKNRLDVDALKPRHTQESLRRDKELLERRTQ
ncbi:MAG: phage holin family protein [Sinobacteraceae bacterium]|nr:phage holin family protein [Nevskiaceae bacterium]